MQLVAEAPAVGQRQVDVVPLAVLASSDDPQVAAACSAMPAAVHRTEAVADPDRIEAGRLISQQRNEVGCCPQ